jgi:hypothetical protein
VRLPYRHGIDTTAIRDGREKTARSCGGLRVGASRTASKRRRCPPRNSRRIEPAGRADGAQRPLALHHRRSHVDATGNGQSRCRQGRSRRGKPAGIARSGANTGSAHSANSIGGDRNAKSRCDGTERARDSSISWRQMASNHRQSLAEPAPTTGCRPEPWSTASQDRSVARAEQAALTGCEAVLFEGLAPHPRTQMAQVPSARLLRMAL